MAGKRPQRRQVPKDAAGVLGVAPRTIAFHKYRIMEEFGLKTNSELFLLAIKEHVIQQP